MLIYEVYFTNISVVTATLLPLLSILILLLLFRRSNNPRSRSRSLGLMMSLSVFFWLFIGLSFLVCFSLSEFSEAYEQQAGIAVRTALGITLLLAVAGGVPLSYILRRYSPRRLLRNAKNLSAPESDLASTFKTLCRKVGVTNAEIGVSETNLPTSFVAEVHRPVVVISQRLLSLLKKDEVEAVIAHELAHVKNSDTTLKAMVTAYRVALPQDPFMRLAEAAFHREREMVADETAVKATGKPLSLTSALLKIDRAFPRNSLRSQGRLSILGVGPSLLNRHPSINDRIEQLVRLAQRYRN